MGIVCCITSYPIRIKNCYGVLSSLLRNTVKPDRIYLTLALPQFPDEILSLPPLLRELCIENKVVHPIWVDMDTKCMKKVLPVLQFIEDENDLILCCDDDIRYPSDYIESRVSDFRKFNGSPLTGVGFQTGRTLWDKWGMPSSIGNSCAFQKKHVANIERFVNQDIMLANNDDSVYSVVEWLNGYEAHDVSRYGFEYLTVNCTFNEVNPSRNSNVYLQGNKLLRALSKRVCEVTGCVIQGNMSARMVFGHYRQTPFTEPV